MSVIREQCLWPMPLRGDVWAMELNREECLEDLKKHYKGSTLFARIQRLFFRCVICCSKLAYAEWRGIWPERVEHDKIAQKVERLFQAAINRLRFSAVMGYSLSSYEVKKILSEWKNEAEKLLDTYEYNSEDKEQILQFRERVIMDKAASHA